MEKILTVGILPPFLEPILFTVHTTVCMHLRHLPSLCIEDVWEQNIRYVKKIARQRNKIAAAIEIFQKWDNIHLLLQKKKLNKNSHARNYSSTVHTIKSRLIFPNNCGNLYWTLQLHIPVGVVGLITGVLLLVRNVFAFSKFAVVVVVLVVEVVKDNVEPVSDWLRLSWSFSSSASKSLGDLSRPLLFINKQIISKTKIINKSGYYIPSNTGWTIFPWNWKI